MAMVLAICFAMMLQMVKSGLVTVLVCLVRHFHFPLKKIGLQHKTGVDTQLGAFMSVTLMEISALTYFAMMSQQVVNGWHLLPQREPFLQQGQLGKVI